jgi:molybdate transport system substrate-binding protein
MRQTGVRLFLAVFCFMLLSGLALAADINLSAAASLKEVVTELSEGFAKKNPGVTFHTNFGGSGALAKQIADGAPAHLFIAANPESMDYLKQNKLIEGKDFAIFAFNQLVFVGKPGLNVASLQDTVKLEKIAIGSPKRVPAGQYAMEAFKKAGIDSQLEKKLVMTRDVRECISFVNRGEVDGAFVYKTDAEHLMAKDTNILFTVPQDLYPRVTYLMALTVTGNKKDEALAFYRFLQSPEAKMVLSKHGFPVK